MLKLSKEDIQFLLNSIDDSIDTFYGAIKTLENIKIEEGINVDSKVKECQNEINKLKLKREELRKYDTKS